MFLLVPSGYKGILEKSFWFKEPIARRLYEEKGVGFGYELKGEPQTIESSPDLYWGYHLPNDLATKYYYHPELRKKLLDELVPVSKLKPKYTNLHGPKIWWKPNKRGYIERYTNHSDPEEYWKLVNITIELINQLKDIFPNLTLENHLLCDFYKDGKDFLPMTSYQTTVGVLNDLAYLKEKTGVNILIDIEHLRLSLNFLNREANYSNLKKEPFELSSAEKEISNIMGYQIQKGFIPHAEPKIDFDEILNRLGEKHYHLTGSTQDVKAGKVNTHFAIEKENIDFKKTFYSILQKEPESMLVEVANSKYNKCYSHYRPNETELSFYSMCEILLERL